MRVRMLCTRPDRPDLDIGTVYDLPDSEATGYLQSGDAEAVVDAEPAPAAEGSDEAAADETAMADPAKEAAVTRRGRPPGR